MRDTQQGPHHRFMSTPVALLLVAPLQQPPLCQIRHLSAGPASRGAVHAIHWAAFAGQELVCPSRRDGLLCASGLLLQDELVAERKRDTLQRQHS